MRAPAPVIIRDDPASGVSAPRAFDFARADASIPKLEELTKAGVSLPPVEYASDALLRWKQEAVSEFDRLGRLGGAGTPDEAREERLVHAAAAEWARFESRDIGSGGLRLVPLLTDALSEGMFSVNRFTRRKPDVRGSSLSMRGLIRFLLTNGSYKKIYQRPLAGPRREYKLCVAFDRSASMMGGAARMSAYAVFAFLAAIKNVGLDTNTTILAFGDSVELVKPDGLPLDARAVYRLLLACQPKKGFSESASLDADAIAVGMGLLQASSARGPSKMFVFTDGYTARPSRLPFTLQAAADSGVDVIAMGVGTGTAGSGLPTAFQNWLAVDQPNLMPQALLAWASGRSGGASAPGRALASPRTAGAPAWRPP
ncbi:hypothetical protein FNF28_06463 [Cafeteria roenbergensis]|uniref:VWFA domain-containing protein n=1 Tax=Cafeteria roenbergensis TaxID=33653 RepID=A0A5A8CZP5_CAFRO|nr:hypothetical protein FNF28_06463 [Cafeteria roenbergensis]